MMRAVSRHIAQHGGRVEIALARQRMATGQQLRAAGHGLIDQRRHRRSPAFMGQRSHAHAVVHSIAHAQRLRARRKACGELLVDALPAHRSAWARRTPARHCGYLEATARSSTASTSTSSNTSTGACPPSSMVVRFMPAAACAASCLPTGMDPVNVIARMTGEAIRCFETSAGTPNTTASTPAGTPASTSACAMASAQAGRFLGRLDDHAATGAQRGAQLARRIAQREIPGRESCHRPHRFLDHRHAHAGDALRQHATVGAAPFFRIPVEDLGGDIQLDARLGQRLAFLQRGQLRNGLAALAHQVRGLAQDAAALLRTQGAPHRPGAPCRLQCLVQVCRCGQRNMPQHLFGCRVDDRARRASLAAEFLAIDEQVKIGVSHNLVIKYRP